MNHGRVSKALNDPVRPIYTIADAHRYLNKFGASNPSYYDYPLSVVCAAPTLVKHGVQGIGRQYTSIAPILVGQASGLTVESSSEN